MPEPLELFAELDDPQPLSPTTPELRASVQARARQIRRQRVAAFAVPASLVAAGVVVLLVIVGLPANRANVGPIAPSLTPTATGNAAPSVTPSPSSTKPPAAAGLPYGKTGTRSQVPWAQVGTGWFLITMIEKGKGELYLTDPRGGRYAITSLPLGSGASIASALADWSPDGRRALLIQQQGTRTLLTEVDLRTGAQHAQNVPYILQDAQYSRPSGTHVLLDAGPFAAPGAQLYRLAWNQTPALLTTMAEGDGQPLYSPDGTYLVLSATDGLTEIGNGGALLRHLAVPGRCRPVKWWSGSQLLASCALDGNPDRLWLVPADGGAATALTPTRSQVGPDLGDEDAWQLTSGLFLHALGPCGSEFLMRQDATGNPTVVSVPGLGNNVEAETGQGSRIAVLGLQECGRASALVWLDPATSRTEPIAAGDIDTVLSWDLTQQ